MARFRLGQNRTVSGARVDVSCAWEGAEHPAPAPVALLLGQDRRLEDGRDVLRTSHPVHASGAVAVYPPREQAVRVSVSLRATADRVGTILVAVAGPGEHKLRSYGRLRGTVLVDDGPVATFDMVPRRESLMIVAEVYRRSGGWKVRAVGQGYADGLTALLEDHGVPLLHAVR